MLTVQAKITVSVMTAIQKQDQNLGFQSKPITEIAPFNSFPQVPLIDLNHYYTQNVII